MSRTSFWHLHLAIQFRVRSNDRDRGNELIYKVLRCQDLLKHTLDTQMFTLRQY
jgi:hypothetical protein